MTIFTGTGGDDTLALRSALASGEPIEASGVSIISDHGAAECLLLDTPPRIYGRDFVLLVASSVPAVPVLRLRPPGPSFFGHIEGVRIVPQSGNPGSDGILIDLDASGVMAKLSVQHVTIAGLGGKAFRQVKASGPDGFFTSRVEDFLFNCQGGGISLERSGDSLSFKNGTITGAGLGVYSESIPGAAQQTFEDLNITSAGGAFYLKDSNQTKITNCQIEQSAAYTGSDDAQVVLDGSFATDIVGCNLNAHGHARSVLIKSGSRNRIRRSVLAVASVPPKFHVCIDNGAGVGNELDGSNTFLVDGVDAPFPYIAVNTASPQVGKLVALPLLNSWTAAAEVTFSQGLFSSLAVDRSIILHGNIRNGVNSAGTLVATLPVGSRPNKNVRVPVRCFDGGNWKDGQCYVDTSGGIRIDRPLPATSIVSFDGVHIRAY